MSSGSFLLCCVGGRGKDGAPIITFPECSGFSEVPEEDFLNVITYLTSIPRYAPTPSPEERRRLSWDGGFATVSSCLCSLDAASIGFIIVIDRRKDKWSSVKASLSRIAVSSLFAVRWRKSPGLKQSAHAHSPSLPLLRGPFQGTCSWCWC